MEGCVMEIGSVPEVLLDDLLSRTDDVLAMSL